MESCTRMPAVRGLQQHRDQACLDMPGHDVGLNEARSPVPTPSSAGGMRDEGASTQSHPLAVTLQFLHFAGSQKLD